MRKSTMAGALKKLYEKVIGEQPTEKTTTQILDEFAENYSGGGGGGAFKVTFTDEGESDPEYTADKTHAEVQAALTAGQTVVGFEDFYKDYYTLSSNNSNRLTFICVLSGAEGTTVKSLEWEADGTITYNEHFVEA